MSAPVPAPASPEDVRRRDAAWSGRVLLGLVVAEFRKAMSTSAWWALLVSAALITLLVTLVNAEFAGLAFLPSLAQAIALGSFAAKFAVVFGLVCATAEHRHRTIATTYLTAPGRGQVLVAKVVIAAGAGAGYGLVCAVFGVVGILIGTGGVGGSELSGVLVASAAALLVFALWAVLGVGVGTLISNQLAAIISVLLYLLLVEQIVVGLAAVSGLGRIDDYLPGGSASATLTGLAEASPFTGTVSGLTLSWWLSLLIFVGYTALAVLAGMSAAQRRDIT
jgi:ABC-type transport system involved in multi-copper enzyme maturation permease subunit